MFQNKIILKKSETKYSFDRQHDEMSRTINFGATVRHIDSKYRQPGFKCHICYRASSFNFLTAVLFSIIWEAISDILGLPGK